MSKNLDTFSKVVVYFFTNTNFVFDFFYEKEGKQSSE